MSALNTVRKVLVVDDDPVVGKSIDRVLGRRGYVVVNAENGIEALKKFASEEYDAVFTDIKMPGMDGVEVAERLHAKRPWTPVVIITGYGSAENEARAEAAGVRGFLRKPLSPEMIETSLADALATASPRPAEAAAEVAPEAAPETGRNLARSLYNVAMFFAAPFVALAYIALLPLIGLGMLAWVGGKALLATSSGKSVAPFLHNAGMLLAAPFIGLAFITLFPLIGLGLLVGMGGKALLARRIST